MEIENHKLDEVAEWLKAVKFKKTFFGGLDEQDVWKKVQELNDLYMAALVAERARYDTLLAEYSGGQKNAAGSDGDHSPQKK